MYSIKEGDNSWGLGGRRRLGFIAEKLSVLLRT